MIEPTAGRTISTALPIARQITGLCARWRDELLLIAIRATDVTIIDTHTHTGSYYREHEHRQSRIFAYNNLYAVERVHKHEFIGITSRRYSAITLRYSAFEFYSAQSAMPAPHTYMCTHQVRSPTSETAKRVCCWRDKKRFCIIH